MKSGGREEYLVYFLFEAVSAALPAEWDVQECRYESARVLTTVTFQFPRQGFVALPWKAYQCESVRPLAVEYYYYYYYIRYSTLQGVLFSVVIVVERRDGLTRLHDGDDW